MQVDPGALLVVGVYLLCLPLIGWMARTKVNHLKEYYLAGGSIGIVSLFFTLYATQYSGNTMLGFAGRAYREGPVSLFTVLGMAAIIPMLMLFGRKLNVYARRYNFVTVADFLRFRYANANLVNLANVLLIITLSSYILTNLKAAGLLLEVISNEKIPLHYGICGLAFVMAIYESLGGMRAVIWTDILQGFLLLIGSLTVFVVVFIQSGVTDNLFNPLDYYSANWATFDNYEIRRGLSLVLMFAIAICIYPHALQRVFAAKNWKTLRGSLRWMLIMPFLTTLPIMLTGMAGFYLFGDGFVLEGAQSDRVIPLLLGSLSQQTPLLKWLLALFMAAALAAIMSTVDSALLSLGSMFTQDIIRPMYPSMSQSRLGQVGKAMTWLLMILIAIGAICVSKTIWFLIVLKLEIMLQVAPCIIFGILFSRLAWKPVFMGLIVGVLITVTLKFFFEAPSYLSGVHDGMLGLTANLITIALINVLNKKQKIGNIP